MKIYVEKVRESYDKVNINNEAYIAENSKSNRNDFYIYVRDNRVITQYIGPLIAEDFEALAKIFIDRRHNPCPEIISFLREENIPQQFDIKAEDILSAIKEMKMDETIGPDKFYLRTGKEAKNEIVRPLSVLFNKLFAAGEVPNEWKFANITPIFSEGNKLLLGNYRPLSLTAGMENLWEPSFEI